MVFTFLFRIDGKEEQVTAKGDCEGEALVSAVKELKDKGVNYEYLTIVSAKEDSKTEKKEGKK